MQITDLGKNAKDWSLVSTASSKFAFPFSYVAGKLWVLAVANVKIIKVTGVVK